MSVCLFVRDVNGVLRRANATEFGLASGVFTRDINKASITSALVTPDHTHTGNVCQ